MTSELKIGDKVGILVPFTKELFGSNIGKVISMSDRTCTVEVGTTRGLYEYREIVKLIDDNYFGKKLMDEICVL